ncbi:hypothetical protein OE88DRAFT_1803992 [Heliocybe sulcata]|uniref:Uncharacterized protein n=1 Tax=Heliocybe sulcata TaxID=5364 RepID=A0A5C3NHQ6_9AGAM|nr:hypothetical protein OE88DRAFT_1803992 [Heliocybe sulcata]
MPSVTGSIADFFSSLVGIFSNLISSILAVFQSIFALGEGLVGDVLQIGQSLLKLVTDLSGSLVGFVAANFFAILAVGGVYYWYTNVYQRGRKSVTGGKKRA